MPVAEATVLIGFATSGLCIWMAMDLMRQTSTSVMLALALLLLALAIWSSSLTLQSMRVDPAWMVLWMPVLDLCKAALAGAFLTFCLDYTRSIRDVRLTTLLIGIPAIISYTLALTNDWHGLWYRQAEVQLAGTLPVLHFQPQLLKQIFQIVNFSSALVGIGLLFDAWRKAQGSARRQLSVVIFGALVICCMLIAARLSEQAINLGTHTAFEIALLACGTVLIWYGLKHISIFTLLPIAHEQVMHDQDDGQIILDHTGVIVSINASAARIFGMSTRRLLLQYPEQVVPNWPADFNAMLPAPQIERFTSDLPLAPHFYEMRTTPLKDTKGNFVGTILRIRDITAQYHSEVHVAKELQQERHLREVTERFSDVLTRDALLMETLKIIKTLVPVDLGVVALVDSDASAITTQHGYIDPLLNATIPQLPRIISPHMRTLLQQNQQFLTNDYPRKPYAIQLLIEAGLQCQIIMPVYSNQQPVGMLILMRTMHKPPFTNDDQQRLQPLLNQFASAFARVQRKELEQQRVLELQSLQTTFTEITAHSELEPLLDSILQRCIELTRSHSGLITQYDEEQQHLTIWASHGTPQDVLSRPPIRLGDGLAGTVAASRQPMIVNDMHGWMNRRNDLGINLTPSAAMAAPLIDQSKLVGVIAMADYHGNRYFQDDDLQLLTLFAQQATIAIQNAKLYSMIQRLAQTDELTGAWNRRHFMELAEAEIQRAQRYPQAVTIALVDIDHFKVVNDTHGHSTGDRALAGLVQQMRSHLRQVDVIGRYGGEEFALCLPQTSQVAACVVIDRLRNQVADASVCDDRELRLTISVGIATFERGQNLLLTELLDQADQALYAAKRNGRNQTCFWDAGRNGARPYVSEPTMVE